MAQHTSRQRVHLLGCQNYLDSMKEQGIENSITRQAADPQAFFKRSTDWAQKTTDTKAPKLPKMGDVSTAVRIQALALAEASIAYDRIQEITGMEPKVITGLRRLARERGYNPSDSMQLKEEYVLDPPSAPRPRGRPPKKRKPDAEVDPALTNMQEGSRPQSPSYTGTPPNNRSNLPPGQWDFIAPTPPSGYTMT
ncbi:hypothetical protein, variant [Cladophialophora immunda]|nr:hypothetical protein, variant [Cladophialophora immunda]KIW31156.1 hypothetical protein, variant [Cladophialophora immunda]OQV00097.1 hypothetical protein CLAIMM_05638 isoform 2 [Cladophialophora immunda]OQV00098.1 hypothetical protein CLAIMM_05638 isoform 3 [Cladophialophora immunda]OQV00099.1 hypothetical protein CLAIMM_05638 isoform 4 [Cladophialophora immunda]